MPVSIRGFRDHVLDFGSFSVRGGSAEAAVHSILERMGEAKPVRVAFCNAHTLALAFRSPSYAEALSGFTVLNDGVGLDLVAALLHGRRFPENLNGTDFIPALLRHAPPSRVFLLGARADVVAEAARHIRDRFGRHEVVGFHHGYFERSEAPSVLARIREARPDILLIGMGNPRQELFTVEHQSALDCPLVVCCGALFDFLTGTVPRAPLWIRRMRLEWAFRLWQEPRRLIGRYTVEAAGLALRLLRLRLGGSVATPPLGLEPACPRRRSGRQIAEARDRVL